jgi:hypothetical protein
MTDTPTLTDNERRRIGLHTCSICGEEYTGFGNNAQPVNPGRCCDGCNWTVVMPARVTWAFGKEV